MYDGGAGICSPGEENGLEIAVQIMVDELESLRQAKKRFLNLFESESGRVDRHWACHPIADEVHSDPGGGHHLDSKFILTRRFIEVA